MSCSACAMADRARPGVDGAVLDIAYRESTYGMIKRALPVTLVAR